MIPPLVCFVCGSKDIVVLHPIPLCAEHNLPPEIPMSTQDSDEEIIFEDFDDEDNQVNPWDDLPIPVYPI